MGGLTTPTEVKAATELMMVGMMLNLPACRHRDSGWAGRLQGGQESLGLSPRGGGGSGGVAGSPTGEGGPHPSPRPHTHVPVHQHVEADAEGLHERAVLTAILHLVVLGEPGSQSGQWGPWRLLAEPPQIPTF